MNKIKFLLVNAILFFCILNSQIIAAEIPYITIDFRAKARQIMNKTGKQLANKYNFEIVGTCAGMMDNVESVGMDFRLNRILTKEEARKIVVDSVNQFLNNFNENIEIRPFLKQYPLTTKNVSVIIHLTAPSGANLYDPDISVVAAYCNKIFYDTNDPNDKYAYKSSIEEPFDEAVRIVQAGIQNTND